MGDASLRVGWLVWASPGSPLLAWVLEFLEAFLRGAFFDAIQATRPEVPNSVNPIVTGREVHATFVGQSRQGRSSSQSITLLDLLVVSNVFSHVFGEREPRQRVLPVVG